MSKMRQVISENTGISISLVLTLVGGIVWLTNLNATASTTALELSKLQKSHESVGSAISEIKERLARIEEKTDRILRRR